MRAAVSSAVDMVLTDESWEPVTRYAMDVRDERVCAFVGRQVHIATEHCGHIDPLDIDEYVAHEGFAALRAAMAASDQRSEKIIDTIGEAGLRGRGGAGFPTARKWAAVRGGRKRRQIRDLQRRRGRPRRFYGPA